jgi:hypothetical protein
MQDAAVNLPIENDQEIVTGKILLVIGNKINYNVADLIQFGRFSTHPRWLRVDCKRRYPLMTLADPDGGLPRKSRLQVRQPEA